MSNEFLRPRENRCKWFNTFEVVRRVQYIGAKGKAKFSHKMNCVNRFTYYLNWFKPYKTRENYDEEWNVSSDNWVDSNSPEGFDTIQNKFELIQTMLESLMSRFTEIWIDSGKKEVKSRCWQHLNWFILFVNRFTCESIQRNRESIHCESIQENCK